MSITTHTIEEINFVKSILESRFNINLSVEEDVLAYLVITHNGQVPDNAEEMAETLINEGFSAFYCDSELICYSQRVAFIIAHHKCSFFINSDEDVIELRDGLAMAEGTLEEVSFKYHELTGGEVYDNRDDFEHQFTNVNAQRDENFWNEENIND